MTKIFLKKKHTISKLEKIKNNELQIRLNELEFSVRALNSLTNQGVKTLGDLVCYKEKSSNIFLISSILVLPMLGNDFKSFSV